MTLRFRLLSKLLLGFFVACALASLVAWGVLLTSFCSNPRTPLPERVVPYSCHGMTVYISPLEDALRYWLIPLGGVFVVLSIVAAIMVVLSYAKVRIDVQIRRN